MSTKKDGPRHGTTVSPFLPGMTARKDTIERYSETIPGVSLNISSDPTVSERYDRMTNASDKRRVKFKKKAR